MQYKSKVLYRRGTSQRELFRYLLITLRIPPRRRSIVYGSNSKQWTLIPLQYFLSSDQTILPALIIYEIDHQRLDLDRYGSGQHTKSFDSNNETLEVNSIRSWLTPLSWRVHDVISLSKNHHRLLHCNRFPYSLQNLI